MKIIELQAVDFTSPQELDAYIWESLGLPNTGNESLDALYDYLTELEDETTVVVAQAIADEENMGEYGERVLHVFEEAAAENPVLSVEFV
ncbi:MAG: barstar family protein [Acidaminococcaceae bacterium]